MASHQMIGANGIEMAYRACGAPAAPPMVLLHALGESAADWEGAAPVLAKDWRVYAPDLRGHGRSDWPGAYSLELMCADLPGLSKPPGCGRRSVGAMSEHNHGAGPSRKAFFANWSTYDASFAVKLRMAVSNTLIKLRTHQSCCGNHGQPGC